MSLSRNPVFRPLLWPTLMTLAALPVLLGLGFWQVDRLTWKEALLAKIEQRMDADPIPLPAPDAWSKIDPYTQEYTRLLLEGRFLPREFHYFQQNAQGTPGYAVISPLEVAEGAVILVNRGFVPAHLKEMDAHGGIPEGADGAPLRFTGILRAPATRGIFDGVDDPEKNVWMVRDPTVMGATLGVRHVAPFIVDAEPGSFPGEYPKAGATRPDLPNNHLDYALTWFGLAAVLIAIYFLYHRANGCIGRPAVK
jgi:surfeit locus 1 family protein